MRLFARGQAMLNRTLGTAGAVGVTYTRGAVSVALAEADEVIWPDHQALVTNQEGAARVEWVDRDYLVKAAALGALGEPREGDQIAETINGVAMKFRVMTPNTGDPAVRPSDPGRTLFRVHTKRVT